MMATSFPLPLVMLVVGTDHHPFDRAVAWVDDWANANAHRARVVIQYGTSRPPVHAEGHDLLPVAELEAMMAEAVAVICHGGPGTIMGARESGVVPICIPRQSGLGEHVDDHQVRFATRVAQAGQVHLASTADELTSLLERALGGDEGFRLDLAGHDPAAAATERFGRLVDRLFERGAGSTQASAARTVRVISITGWGRSGSTLLDRLLGQVPGVCSIGELRELWQRGLVEDRLCGCGERFHDCELWRRIGERAFGGWDRLDAAEVAALRARVDRAGSIPRVLTARAAPVGDHDVMRYAELLGQLYRAIADVTGARVIVDSSKLPTHSLLLRQIPGVDLRVLHLVRDPRGVVFSWQKEIVRADGDGRDHLPRYGVAAASIRYLLYNAAAHVVRTRRVPSRFLRYEDLVARPAQIVADVLRWAEVDVAEGDLAFMHDGVADLGVDHTVDGNPMRLLQGPVEVTVDDEWRRSLRPRQWAVVSAITAPLIAMYGYALWGERS
ncbi:MAG: sulfotransferase [Actinomycetota bacterium]